MRIALLVSGLPPDRIGGAEVQAMHASRHLAMRGHDVVVYTRTARIPPELAAVPRCTVVRRCGVQIPGARFVVDLVMSLSQLWKARQSIDAILAYQTVIDGVIAVAARLWLKVPVVVSVRSPLEYAPDNSWARRALTRIVCQRADRIAMQTEAMADALVRALCSASVSTSQCDALRRRLFVMPNGIDEGATEVRPEVVLFIGRLVPVKGVEFLLEAARHCPTERFMIVGDGPQRARLEDAARDLNNVTFVGMVPHADVAQHLDRAKMLVVPSLQEGQPNVVMEAMVRGVPVIASRVGGLPELVREGQTGFLVEPGDVSALIDRIHRLAGDATLRSTMAHHATRAMERHRWSNVITALEDALAQVPGRRTGDVA